MNRSIRRLIVAVAMMAATGVAGVIGTPAHAAKVQLYSVASAVDAPTAKVIDAAMAVAPPLPCAPTFIIEPTPGAAGFASSDCSVHLDPSNFDSWNVVHAPWYPAYVVRHEIAHLATMGHGHDALFRQVLAEMIRPVHLREVYGPTGEYPQQVWHYGKCVLCP